MPNIDLIKNYNRVHMLGIGGVSMSGIAEILNNFGVTVTGSDMNDSEIIHKLISNNIKVTIGHNLEDLSKAEAVIYSAAIKDTDPEMVKAKELNIPTIERCDFLGMLTKAFENTIGVSGTHGKTTTTSMVSLCFIEAGLDPSIQVGAILKAIDGNYRIGNSENFIIEACEYVESFLKFYPKAEIILNIDNDHLDYFKNIENIQKAFAKYVRIIPNDGLLVLNGDDSKCLELAKETNAKTLTYGITNKNTDFFAVNIAFDNDGFPEFDVYKEQKFYNRFKLYVPGMHNILNALACISLCDSYGISSETIKTALTKFRGANRRFEYKGKVNGSSIFDDYGHHPTEILATAKALMNKKYNKSWVVFQPHTYSRTFNLLEDFAHSLLNFDNIIVVDIYAARETNTYNISSKDLVDKLVSFGANAKYIPEFDETVKYLKQNVKENDIVLTLGAGTVTKIGPMLKDAD